MGQVLKYPARSKRNVEKRTGARARRTKGTANILIFTGVQYEHYGVSQDCGRAKRFARREEKAR